MKFWGHRTAMQSAASHAGGTNKPNSGDDGFTATEFAMISIPFLMLLFGILGVCLYFFTVFSMEQAVASASRDIRTGSMQNGTGSYVGMSTPTQMQNKFREIICAKSPGYIAASCATNVRVMVQSSATFGNLAEPNCLAPGGAMKSDAQAAASFTPGGSSSVVFATACVSYSLWKIIPFFPKPNQLPDGNSLIQASTTFRTEPY